MNTLLSIYDAHESEGCVAQYEAMRREGNASEEVILAFWIGKQAEREYDYEEI